MKFETHKKLNAHFQKFAHNLKPDETALSYKIATLESEQEKNFFAKLKENDLFQILTLVPVNYAHGEAIGFIQGMPGTTDTEQFARKPKLLANRLMYFCQQMNIDSRIKYDKLNNFVHTELDFVEEFERYLDKHLLGSVLMVGLNGTHRADNSSPDTALHCQDVQKGWLQKIRDHAAQNSGQGVLNVGVIGESGKYKTISKAIKAGLMQIKPIYADGDLIAICGRNVIEDEAIENNKDELEGQFITRLQKLLGGCKAITVPHFPPNAILLTRLDNLALYVHRNNIRRGFIEEPEFDMLSHYFSFNIDFIVENFDACCLLENIELAE